MTTKLTPAQATLARQVSSLTGSIESQRWKLAEIAYKAERQEVPAWAEVVAVNCGHSPSTIYEWRRAWELRKSVNYRWKLSISFYVSAANKLSAGADTEVIMDWLKQCAADRTITLESARANLSNLTRPLAPPLNLCDFLADEYERLLDKAAEFDIAADRATVEAVAAFCDQLRAERIR